MPLPKLAALVTGIADIFHRAAVPDQHAAMATRAEVAYGQVMDLAIRLGGTITGEHGAGRTKKAWLPDYVREDVVALNRKIKDALDPRGLLNPGAIL